MNAPITLRPTEGRVLAELRDQLALAVSAPVRPFGEVCPWCWDNQVEHACRPLVVIGRTERLLCAGCHVWSPGWLPGPLRGIAGGAGRVAGRVDEGWARFVEPLPLYMEAP